jgi:hypothetical protein
MRNARRVVHQDVKDDYLFVLSDATTVDARDIDIFKIDDPAIAAERLEILERYGMSRKDPEERDRFLARADRLQNRILRRWPTNAQKKLDRVLNRESSWINMLSKLAYAVLADKQSPEILRDMAERHLKTIRQTDRPEMRDGGRPARGTADGQDREDPAANNSG